MFSMIFLVVLLSAPLPETEYCVAPYRCIAIPEAPFEYTDRIVVPVPQPKQKVRVPTPVSSVSFMCGPVAPAIVVVERPANRSHPRHKELIRKLSGSRVPTFIREFLGELTSSGRFERSAIEKLFDDPRLKVYRQVPSLHAGVSGCRKLRLKQAMLSTESVEHGLMFLQEHEQAFRRAEMEYHVDRYTIAAVIRIESDFGRNLGDYDVLSMLYSFYVTGDGRMKSKSAEQRLRALPAVSRIHKDERGLPLDMFAMKGSHRAAMGYGQFVPDTFVEQARDTDADGDGNPSLFSPRDQIVIIAKYLVDRGWIPGNEYAQTKALQRYLGGGSKDWMYYSETIIPYAETLKHEERTRKTVQIPTSLVPVSVTTTTAISTPSQ